MLGTAFTVFWISIAVVLSLDFITAIVLCIVENKLKNKHPADEGKKMVADVTTAITGEVVYLQVKEGVVKVIDELPVVKVRVAGAPAAGAVYEPVEGDVVEESAVAEESVVEEIADDEEGRVVFIASEKAKQTYLDKLAALDKKDYSLYEQLVNYLISKENVKLVTTTNKGIFKYKTDRLAMASVRRGIVTLQFNLINSSLERYMRAEGAKDIKVTPVTIRLTDEASLARAKSTADLTLEYLEQERQYNAEQKKAARREARRAKAEAEKAAAAAASTDDNKN